MSTILWNDAERSMKQYAIHNNTLELVVILISFVNIFLGIIPVLPLVLVMVVISLFRLDLISAFIFSCFITSRVLGFSSYYLGISSYGYIIEILLFLICLFQWKVTKKIRLANYRNGITLLLLVFLLLVVSAFINVGGDYYIQKLLETFKNGILYFFAFGFLFSNEKRVDYVRLGLTFILFSILMLLLSSLLNNGSGPENFLDFGYMRNQNIEIEVKDPDAVLVSYHYVGLFALMGCSFIVLASNYRKISSLFMLFCFIISILVSLYAGARQFIVISVVMAFLWFFSQKGKGMSGRLLFVLGVCASVLLVYSLFAEGGLLNSVKEEGYLEASNRGAILLKAVGDFTEHPLFGIGYGHFEFFGEYGGYPHNMFVELLCELGIFGLSVLLIIVVWPLKQMLLYHKSCIYLLVVFFLRSMTSGGFDSNIMLFSYIFAAICLGRCHTSMYDSSTYRGELANLTVIV